MKTRFLFLAAILLVSMTSCPVNASPGLIERAYTFPSTGFVEYPADDPTLKTEGSRIVDSSGNDFVPFGVNVMSPMFPPDYDIDRPPEQPTPALLDKLKTLKANLVRITLVKEAWDDEVGYKECIDQWVNGLAERRIRSYLDLHDIWYVGSGYGPPPEESWHSWMYEAMTSDQAKRNALFTLYEGWAERYGEQKYMVGINIANEPFGWATELGVSIDDLRSAWRSFIVDAVQHIHSINPDLLVFVNGDGLNYGAWLEAFVGDVPVQGNVVYTVHHYPEDHLHNWAGSGFPEGSPTNNYAQTYENGDFTLGYSQLQEWLQWSAFDLLSDNVPVLIEEFGFSEGRDQYSMFANWERVCDDFYEICYGQGIGVLQWQLARANDKFGVLEGSDWLILTEVGQKWAENLNLYAE